MQNYESYEQFAQALALNLKRHFYRDIYAIVEGLIKAKKPEAAPVLIFSNTNSDSEENNNDGDPGPSNKRRRLDP